MPVKKIVRLWIESRTVWVIHWRGAPTRVWCQRCGGEVEIIPVAGRESLRTMPPRIVRQFQSPPTPGLWEAAGKGLRFWLSRLASRLNNKGDSHETNHTTRAH